MLGEAVLIEIEKIAKRLGIEPAALAAVAHIESGLRTHAMVGGKAEPLIRFEGHYFDRRLSGAKREEARRSGLASPEAGAIANPPSQSARWSLLARAARLDRRAAYESSLIGLVGVKLLLYFFLARSAGHSLLFAVGALAAA